MAPTVCLSLKMMSKSQKFSGGKSSGFVPDYRHTVEMVGEPEGMGSLGRADSEDSSAPKRKCISLNVGRDDGFNVPQRFISLSKLLGSERKELEMGLRAELEQVQALQKRICSMAVTSTSAVAVPSSGNGHEKKRGPVGSDGSKRGAAGRSDSTKQVQCPPVINSDVLLMKQSEQLLKRLMSHKFGSVFNTPVDVVKLKVPDYYTVIKHPMDFGTIKSKIASGAYSNPWGFAADVRLTFTNAMTYNPPGNDFHFMADVLSKFFETRWRPIEKKLAAGVKRKAEPPMMVPQPKKRKVPVVNHHIIMQETVKPNITVEEKESLSRQLRSLIAELPEHIINFIRRHGNNVTCDDEIKIDINSLSDDTLFELRRLLDDYLREKQTRQHAKAVSSGIEIPNESGPMNSSKHPFTGGDAPSGRPVSPDKLYRAALLRSRFADTILKAREKTLGQSEKEGDPEKLQREREELERQQSKERARLQAEAKAAEEACRRAKAEAAAEAKRKRELEREAARQALLKMEKTVEINENNLIYKDLEMLGAARVELVYSSVGETSPDLSPDGLGCYQLGGSNPLEKLGLFMKADDDDEDEVAEPSRAPTDDVEEGEIR